MQKVLGPARTPYANSAKTQDDVIMSLIIQWHHLNNYRCRDCARKFMGGLDGEIKFYVNCW